MLQKSRLLENPINTKIQDEESEEEDNFGSEENDYN